jgi:tRNA(Ile)-lysidine synthase
LRPATIPRPSRRRTDARKAHIPESRDAHHARTVSRPDRHPAARALRAHLRRTNLIPPGAHVLVALSGGLDSVVLLHLLRFGRVARGIHVAAAHYDHAWRGESAADAAWVRGLCHAWEVQLAMERAAHAQRSEGGARAHRYDFLQRAAAPLEASCIATAHHADDQAETVLFRMLRGTGIAGLAGIPARRGNIVRPLLPFRRVLLADYARVHGLQHREDVTNRDVSLARNRLRHDILPRLEAVRPGAAGALTRIAEEAAALESVFSWLLERLENEAVSVRSDGALQLARPVLLSYHPWVRARVMRRALRRLDVAPDRAGTLAALEFITTGGSGGGLELPRGIRIEREFDQFVVRRSIAAVSAERPLTILEPGSGHGQAVIGGRHFTVRWTTTLNDEPAEAFDQTTLRFPLELRSWRPGDRIRLAYGSKKLKKLFAEKRVARGARSRIPVLADRADRVIWVVGLARAAGTEPVDGGSEFRITVANGERS